MLHEKLVNGGVYVAKLTEKRDELQVNEDENAVIIRLKQSKLTLFYLEFHLMFDFRF